MTTLPDPASQPDAFLAALCALGDITLAAGHVSYVLHRLGAPDGSDTAALAGLHAAGARAIAASLAIGATPMVLAVQPDDPGSYLAALDTGLMGYERIHVAQSGSGDVLILILPPVTPSSYWRA